MNILIAKILFFVCTSSVFVQFRWPIFQRRVARLVGIRLPGLWFRFWNPPLSTQPVPWQDDDPLETLEEARPLKKGRGAAVPPNVLLIVADDLGINDIHGGLGVSTPNIDALRDQGVHFPNAYSGQSTCAPARAAMLTGRNPTKIGFEFTPIPAPLLRAIGRYSTSHPYHPNRLLTENLPDLPPFADMVIPKSVAMLPETLRSLGYKNYLLGKWHLGSAPGSTPIDRGFHESLVFPMTLSKYYPADHPDLVNAPVSSFFEEFLRENMPYTVAHNNGQPFEPDDYMTDYLTTQAERLIETRARPQNRDRPFFAALMYSAAHNPLQARRADYEDEEVQRLPDETHRVYAAMVKALDRGVGRVMAALRATHQLENTLVIFTSDNGGAQYIGVPSTNKPYRGFKCTFFEGGVRVPLFINWPAVLPPRSAYAEMVTHMDLFATIVAAAGADIEKTTRSLALDGVNLLKFVDASRSIASLSKNETKRETARETEGNALARPHEYLYWRSGHYRVFRERDLKLQVMRRPDRVHWHDLRSDPLEKENLAVRNGVTSFTQLEVLFNETLAANKILVEKTQHTIADDHSVENLLRHYAAMLEEEKKHREPLWKPALEAAFPVDKSSSELILPTDEYVYFIN